MKTPRQIGDDIADAAAMIESAERRAVVETAAAYIRQERAHAKALIELLREARAAISDELSAAGEGEVSGNPILRGHARTRAKIDRLLARYKSADTTAAKEGV